MKKHIFGMLLLTMAGAGSECCAQWYNNATIYNAGSMAADLGGQGHNIATAVYSTAGSTGAPSNYGVFYHYAQSGTGANAALINDGTYDAAVFGRDYFMGPNGSAGQQEIAGISMPVFGELFLQNGAGSEFTISNTNGIRIATTVYFENGITTTIRSNATAGAIKLDDNATTSNTALGDAQHVNGYVTKKGDDIFAFPVGSGTDLRTLTISQPASATDEYGVAWIEGDPSANADPSDAGDLHSTTAVTAPIASVSQVGQWDWVALSGTGAGLVISVSIPDLSGTGAIASDLRLVGWDGSSWVALPGSTGASGITEGSTLSGTMQAGITALAIGAISTVLPVTLVDFSVAQQGNTAVLSWTTASEQNNKGFELQRSPDGINWGVIGFINSKAENGHSDTELDYYYTDLSPLAGINFYRLRQTDIDNRATYSAVRTVGFGAATTWRVYPNPVVNNVLSIQGLGNRSHISISNTDGRVWINEIHTGNNIKTVDLSRLPAGVYILNIIDERGLRTHQKLIKQ